MFFELFFTFIQFLSFSLPSTPLILTGTNRTMEIDLLSPNGELVKLNQSLHNFAYIFHLIHITYKSNLMSNDSNRVYRN